MIKKRNLACLSLAVALGLSAFNAGASLTTTYADKVGDNGDNTGDDVEPKDETDEEFEKYLDEQGFPESYKPGLRELHKKYSKWKFEAFHTGLTWKEVIEAEMYQARNLIPNRGYVTSFFDTKNPWSYNWLKDDWNVLSAPYWIQVSEEGLSYFLDPRNWFTEEHVFEFERLTYNEKTQTIDAVQQILKGTFMENTYVDGSKENQHFDSATFSTTDEYVAGLKPGMNVKQVLEALDLYDDERFEISVCDDRYHTKQQDEIVGTGDRIRVIEWVPYEVEIESDDPEEEPRFETKYKAEYVTSYQIIVFGDLNGDGKINATDRAYLKGYVLGVSKLSDIKLKAADINQDGKVNATDRAYLKGHVLGVSTINQGLKNSNLTYADVFYSIGKDLGVSPVMLAYRVRIEQGVAGTSELISGKVKGYEGYYNYYNIGAFGETREQIVTNGMNEAVAEGWTNQYLALVGGATKLIEGHIAKGQDTLYLQKFDVEGEYFGYYWHQYMQNVTAPYSEGNSSYRAYRELGVLNSEFTFKIPVYLDMPASCPEPTNTGNPNPYLSSLWIDGYQFTSAYNLKGTKYKTTIPLYVREITINAKAIAGTTKIEGAGTIKIDSDTSEIYITTIAENGDRMVYTIYLKRA